MKAMLNKIYSIIKFLIYILLLVLVFVNSKTRYIDFNMFEKLFKAPFLEATYYLNRIFDFRIAYFLTFILGYLFIWPTFSSCLKQLGRMSKVWKKIMILHNKKCDNDEEQIKKVQEMLDVYEKEGMSFTSIVALILCVFLGIYFLRFIFKDAFSFEYFNINSLEILWFELNSKDNLFILPIFFVVLAFIIPIVTNVYKIFKCKKDLLSIDMENINHYEKVKANLIFAIIINLASATLLLSPVFNSVIFNIFILIPYIKGNVSKLSKGVINNVKTINKNKCS